MSAGPSLLAQRLAILVERIRLCDELGMSYLRGRLLIELRGVAQRLIAGDYRQ